MNFLGLASIAFLNFAAADIVQDSIYHASKISAHEFSDLCEHTLDLDVTSNADALYDKMIEKKVKRVWVCENTQAIIRENGNLYTKKKYSKGLNRELPYVCGSKPYEKKTKKSISKKLVSTKSEKTEDTEIFEEESEGENVESEEKSNEEKSLNKSTNQGKKTSKSSAKIVKEDNEEEINEESVEHEEKKEKVQSWFDYFWNDRYKL